jgi:uncharacterized protein YjcR
MECKKCGKEISDTFEYCDECRDLLKAEELNELIHKYTFLKIGEMYGVSDNAVKKWCKLYNLPAKKSEIKQFSNEEWNKI